MMWNDRSPAPNLQYVVVGSSTQELATLTTNWNTFESTITSKVCVLPSVRGAVGGSNYDESTYGVVW